MFISISQSHDLDATILSKGDTSKGGGESPGTMRITFHRKVPSAGFHSHSLLPCKFVNSHLTFHFFLYLPLTVLASFLISLFYLVQTSPLNTLLPKIYFSQLLAQGPFDQHFVFSSSVMTQSFSNNLIRNPPFSHSLSRSLLPHVIFLIALTIL